jgi:hypothetical protein
MATLSPDLRAEFRPNPDRRLTSRFPFGEEVRYRVINSRAKANKIAGSGRTLNIGSGGIFFTTEHELPVGRNVEVAVNWPARLDGTCPLQFVVSGRVVRAESNRAAVRIERYQFKTRRLEPAQGLTLVK